MEEKNEAMIQNFGDMVEATDRLTRPWRKAFWLSNILWAIIVALLISYAYLIPSEMSQEQNLTAQHQAQVYIDGATSGN